MNKLRMKIRIWLQIKRVVRFSFTCPMRVVGHGQASCCPLAQLMGNTSGVMYFFYVI